MSTMEHSWSSPLSMHTWHRALSDADARDKLLRLAQYSCKLLRAMQHNKPFTSSSSRTLLALESALATSRQIARLLKWTSIYVKRRSSSPPTSAVSCSQHVLSALSDAALFAYYLCDNFAFLCKTGVAGGDVGAASRRAATFWMASVLTAALHTLLSLLHVRRQVVMLRRMLAQSDHKQSYASRECARNVRKTALLQATLCATLVKQVADVLISFSLCRTKPMHNAITGACGILSSTIGCCQAWPTSDSNKRL